MSVQTVTIENWTVTVQSQTVTVQSQDSNGWKSQTVTVEKVKQ